MATKKKTWLPKKHGFQNQKKTWLPLVNMILYDFKIF